MKVLWRTDVHVSDHSPSSRKDNWTETVLDKIRQTYQIATSRGCSAIIDGGDFFHLKSPSRNSHELIAAVIKIHNEFNIPVYANVGNHDLKYGSMEFLAESPLSVLFESGVFQRLYNEHEFRLSDDEVRVRFTGIPYHGTNYQTNRFLSQKKTGWEHHLVTVAHVLASKDQTSMFESEDVVQYKSLVDFDPDVWMFGHWHKDQGITKIGEKQIVNIGSLSRGSISVDDVARIPSVAILTFTVDSIGIEKIPLSVQPASDIFDFTKRERESDRNDAIKNVVSKFKDTLLMHHGGSLQDRIRNMKLDDRTMETAIHYIDANQ